MTNKREATHWLWELWLKGAEYNDLGEGLSLELEYTTYLEDLHNIQTRMQDEKDAKGNVFYAMIDAELRYWEDKKKSKGK